MRASGWNGREATLGRRAGPNENVVVLHPDLSPMPSSLVFRSPTALLSTALVAAAACSDGAPSNGPDHRAPAESQPVAATATDSAGIVIRTTSSQAMERIAFTAVTPPLLALDGAEDGGEPFHAIGAIAATPDGGFAVADRGEMAVRIHDDQGRRLRTAGREGEGPGEFGALNGLGFLGDSLVVFDSRWSRISVFDGGGVFVREISPRADWGTAPRWVGLSSQAGLLTLSRGSGSDLLWGLHDVAGEPKARLLDIPPAPAPTMAMLGPSGSASSLPPLEIHTRRPGASLFRSGVASFEGDALEVRLHSSGGRIEEIWRVEGGLGRRVSDDDVAGARDRALGSADPALRPLLERQWANVQAPERFPALGSGAGMIYSAPPEILESATGDLWVHGYPTHPDEPRRWWVFGRDGALQGRVDLPPRFELHAVTRRGAMGVELDAFDVERVVLYRLERPSPSTSASGATRP